MLSHARGRLGGSISTSRIVTAVAPKYEKIDAVPSLLPVEVWPNERQANVNSDSARPAEQDPLAPVRQELACDEAHDEQHEDQRTRARRGSPTDGTQRPGAAAIVHACRTVRATPYVPAMPGMNARELAAIAAVLDRIDARKPAPVAADRRREDDAALLLRRIALDGKPPRYS